MQVINFDNFDGGDPLDQSYGYVLGATISSGTGIGGSNSLRTTTPMTDGLNNGVYEGFATQSRSGCKAVWSNFTVAGASDSALIDVWQGDSFLQVRPSGTSLLIWTVNDGVIYTATSAITASTFKRIDLQWTVSSLDEANQLNYDGSVELKINLVTVVTLTNLRLGFALPEGDDERDVFWNVVVFNPHGDGDKHILSKDTGYMPDGVEIYNKLPTADGSYTEMALSTGTSSFALVDEATPDDNTTYLSVTGNAKKASFDFQDFSSIGTKFVYGIKHVAYGRKMEPGYRRFRPLVVRAGLPFFASVDYPSGVGYFAWMQHIWETDPFTGKRWLIDDINETEFGCLVG